ncbi:MAG: ORF6C domain-containing protein [Clostridia bacterium]|nr:ORF6C domain-containing protein [Clostridia bacterium]
MTKDQYEKLQEQVQQGNHLAEMEEERIREAFQEQSRGAKVIELANPADDTWNRTVSAAITEIMRPVIQSMGKLLQQNAEALERLAASQAVQNNRLEALEKQIRLQTPVTAKQAQYMNDAIRTKARELLDKRELSGDKWAVTKLGNVIRKDVLARYGVAGLREIPRHEYQVAMNQIGMWSNALVIRDVAREARERNENA